MQCIEMYIFNHFKGIKLNEDEEMMYRHGMEYGDGIPCAEEDEGNIYYLFGGRIPPCMQRLNVSPIVVGFTVSSLTTN